MKIKDLLLFQQLSEDEIKRSLVCSRSQEKIYEKNTYIFQQDQTPQWLYLVLEGQVHLGQVNFMGRQTYLECLGEGQCFGETDLFLERTHYNQYAVAKTRVRVLAVSRHFFQHTCEKNCAHHSRIIFNMMHIFAETADKNTRKIQLLSQGSLRQRIALYLQEQSRGQELVNLPLNREDLAAFLNTARPSLSRELSSMQAQGTLQLLGRSQVRILDFQKLQEVLDGV